MLIIDNVDFARTEQKLEHTVDISSLSRTADLLDNLHGTVHFLISGSVDSKNRPMLTVEICGKIATLCQSCLEEMDISFTHTALVPIFYNEDDLDNALFGDEATDEDGVLAESEFNVLDFIEDELITLLPLAPKHETCQPISYIDDVDSPFGALKHVIN